MIQPRAGNFHFVFFQPSHHRRPLHPGGQRIGDPTRPQHDPDAGAALIKERSRCNGIARPVRCRIATGTENAQLNTGPSFHGRWGRFFCEQVIAGREELNGRVLVLV